MFPVSNLDFRGVKVRERAGGALKLVVRPSYNRKADIVAVGTGYRVGGASSVRHCPALERLSAYGAIAVRRLIISRGRLGLLFPTEKL